MILCYGRPTCTWAITGTWSPAFELDAAGDSTGPSLSDRDPQIPARFPWRVATPATSDYADLTATYSPAITVGFAALLGGNLPVGTIVEVRDASSLLATGAIVEGPMGDRKVCLSLATPTSTSTLVVRIYNDDGSTTTLTSGQMVDVGEIWFGQTQDLDASSWSTDWVSPEVESRSVVNSLTADRALPYRQLSITPVTRELSELIGGVSDLETLLARLNRGQFCMLTTVTTSANEVNRSSIFGKLMSGGGYSHVARRYFAPGTWLFEESPSPPA